MVPQAFGAFCESFTAEMTRLRREHLAELAGARRELAKVDREIENLLQVLKSGLFSAAVTNELAVLEARKSALATSLAEPALPAMHPSMAGVFRAKVTALAADLEHEEHRDAAQLALRGLVESIVIPPGDGLLRVTGYLGAMLATAAGRQAPGRQTVANVGCGGGI